MALELQRILNNSYANPFNSLVDLVDLASTAGEMYLVAPEDIRSEVYVFDTRGEETATLESDITDNWVEDNTTMQDHIGLKPLTITLRGYVGELTNKPNVDLQQLEQKYLHLSKNEPQLSLAALNPFLPTLTTQAQYVVNRAEEVYGIYKKANRTVDRLEDRMDGVATPDNVSNQQKVWGRFYDIWKKRSRVTVYTPFGVYNSMAILSLNAKQDEDSAYISEFSVTFKEIRIASKISTYTDPVKQKKAKAGMTMANQQDKGVKKPASKSWAKHAKDVGPVQAVKDLMSGRVP